MKSVDDTFYRLRRVKYEQACAIYCIATIHLPSTTPIEQLHLAAKEDLRVAGWTIEELNAESFRLINQRIHADQCGAT